MSFKNRFFTFVLILLLVIISGCASMTSTKSELQNIKDNEGVVIGSVLVSAEKVDPDESGWAFLKGIKAEKTKFSVSISESKWNPLQTTYKVPAVVGKEEIFIKKLPAGNYNMDSLYTSGLLNAQMSLRLAINFNVKPKQTIYIGKLVVSLPARLRAGSGASVVIVDNQQETIEKLRSEYGSIVSDTVKELATSKAFP